MAMGKNYRVLEKNKTEQTHSIILEHRARPETLLLESHTIANLCKIIDFPPTSLEGCMKMFSTFYSCSRNGSRAKAVCEDSRRLWLSRCAAA